VRGTCRLEAPILALEVVLDLLAHELLSRPGQDARPARLFRLHLDVVPAWSALGPEVDAPAREAGRRREAGVHLGELPDDDAAHGLVVDDEVLRVGNGRLRREEAGASEASKGSPRRHGRPPGRQAVAAVERAGPAVSRRAQERELE